MWWGVGLACTAGVVAVAIVVVGALRSPGDRPFPDHRIELGPDDLLGSDREEPGKDGPR